MLFIVSLVLVLVWVCFFGRKVYNHEYGLSFQRRIVSKCVEKGVSGSSAFDKLNNRRLLIKYRDELASLDPEFRKSLPVEQYSVIIKMMDEKRLESVKRMEVMNPYKGDVM